ncbi:hypothetical protein [Candidatus Entotheonella palauensis]|uniref:Uncharacterized protein n=1 Tax=Candidatus Entotheonella gemina TaxID=1429439 RepID=W4M3X6_9BACT|nr:hypothetical protein [Candidatus Entotheonella palauensis]ETX04317.1 MAG: hypothetical protein ETSY2_29460 [Candidatus Entotheonella gemina]
MIRYAILFEVRVLHDYFLNRGSRVHESLDEAQREALMRSYTSETFLEVAPARYTEKLLAGHNMIFKTTATGFLVAVKTAPSPQQDQPAIALGANFRLAFALRISDPHFFNYTALAASSPTFYRFSNDTGNEVAGDRFLSAPVPDFDATRAYEASEVYADSSGSPVDLFRALRDTGPSATPITQDWERIPPDTWNPSTTYTEGAVVLFDNQLYRALVDSPSNDLSDNTQWALHGTLANRYATAADHRILRPTLFNLDLSGAALSQATVRLFRPGEITAVAERVYSAESGNLDTVQLDLRHLAPGSYRLEVLNSALTVLPGLGSELYLDAEAVREGWFGVIEIGMGSGDSALLNNDGTFRSPQYTLRFLNRATRWRYIFPSAQPVGTGAEVAPEDGDNRFLVTGLPRSLTRFGTGTRLQADMPETPSVSEEVLLPEPQPKRIRRQNAQWYSEIHVSNLPL